MHMNQEIFWKQEVRLTFVHDFVEFAGDDSEFWIGRVPDLKQRKTRYTTLDSDKLPF
jgi:hypothetical protein